MGNIPAVPLDTVEMLRLHQVKEGYTNATLATALEVFGWRWETAHVAALIAGRLKPTAEEVIFIQRYLLGYYVAYCRS